MVSGRGEGGGLMVSGRGEGGGLMVSGRGAREEGGGRGEV